jgi:hypothetical protein
MFCVVQGIPRQARDDNGVWDDNGDKRAQKKPAQSFLKIRQVLFFPEI